MGAPRSLKNKEVFDTLLARDNHYVVKVVVGGVNWESRNNLEDRRKDCVALMCCHELTTRALRPGHKLAVEHEQLKVGRFSKPFVSSLKSR